MKKTILIAAVMFFAFSVAASAQVTALFDVGSTPVTTDASCGKTEKVGQIVFSTVSGSSPVITGTISINYQVPVSSTATATITVIQAAGTAGANVVAGAATILSTTGSPILQFQVNPGAGLTLPVNIIVDGVRVDVSGSPNLANLTATITGVNESFVAGETSVVVVSSISSALNSTITMTTTPANISSVAPVVSANPAITVKEGFLGAWISGAAIQFNFSALPKGVTLTFPTTAAYGTGGVFTLLPSLDTTSTATPKTAFASTDGAFTVVYRLTTLATPPATPVLNTLTITPTLAAPVSAAPLGLGSVTVSAQMAALTPATVLPQYVSGGCVTGSATVLTVVPASTTLLMPYATVGGLYDTGIAISNTTTDPANGSTVLKQDGAITFYFFSQDGTSFQFPAAGATLATGKGLTSGVLKSGGLYTVLLSELITAAGKGPAFSGYIFAVVNATNAHGQYFISDFKAFTNGALMLVVDPGNRNVAVEHLDN